MTYYMPINYGIVRFMEKSDDTFNNKKLIFIKMF